MHSNERQLSQVFLANTCPDSLDPGRSFGMPDKFRTLEYRPQRNGSNTQQYASR